MFWRQAHFGNDAETRLLPVNTLLCAWGTWSVELHQQTMSTLLVATMKWNALGLCDSGWQIKAIRPHLPQSHKIPFLRVVSAEWIQAVVFWALGYCRIPKHCCAWEPNLMDLWHLARFFLAAVRWGSPLISCLPRSHCLFWRCPSSPSALH